MADSDKNILITPNNGVANVKPTIVFTGFDNAPITLNVLDDGTVSFEATAGQLFSISDGLSGTIFSVNDISGMPSIEVFDTGNIHLGEFGGNVRVGNGNIIMSAANGNITGNYFIGTATAAQYSDLAEKYTADANYAPGTVVHFGGTHELSLCDEDHCQQVAGVVSSNPAYLMNNMLIEPVDRSHFVVDLALAGRVPCNVIGIIHKGDMLVSAGNGRARAELNPKIGSVIGKALEDHFVPNEGIIEVVVGRL